MQDFRTNLLQEREYDMIRAALKPKTMNDPIPNTRVQDFNEDFKPRLMEKAKLLDWPGLHFRNQIS